MKLNALTLLGALAALVGSAVTASADHIWINEIHYDNVGTDAGEFVEIAIRTPNASGFTAADYSIELYNGSAAPAAAIRYDIDSLSTATVTGPFPILGSTDVVTLYTINYPSNGIQNGVSDGIALVNVTNSTVSQFLSYEGPVTATGTGVAGGAAAVATALTVLEDGTGTGTSLGAVGTGFGADQFGATTFALLTSPTAGGVNTDQVLAVPEPSAAVAALLGLSAIGALSMRARLG